MAKEQITVLEDMRLSRTAARQLRARIESHTLTEAEGLRLIGRVLNNYDRMLGQVELEERVYGALPPELFRPAGAPALVAIDGGRA